LTLLQHGLYVSWMIGKGTVGPTQRRIEPQGRVSPSGSTSHVGTPERIKTALMRAIELAENGNRTLAAIRSTLEFEGYSPKIIDDAFSRAPFRADLARRIKRG
jgi:hypothetical protein